MRRPGLGALLGIIIGLAVAIILQQQGVWPLDKITVFLLPAATGLVGIIVLSIGREGGTITLTISLIIVVAAGAYGATGLGDINEQGQLNGGCIVTADSGIDETIVEDTSRRDPFMVDPDGSLEWFATSIPNVFMDYDWEIWVEFGGIQVVWDSGHEGNEGGSEINGDTIPNIGEEAEARGVDITNFLGIYKVGGFAATCDGFGFVKLIADPFETLASQIALAIAIIALIILIVLALRGRGGRAALPNGDLPNGDIPNGDLPNGPIDNGDLGAGTVAAAGAAGAALADDDDDDSEGVDDDDDVPEDWGRIEPDPSAEIAAGAVAAGYADIKPGKLERDDAFEIQTAAEGIVSDQVPPPLPGREGSEDETTIDNEDLPGMDADDADDDAVDEFNADPGAGDLPDHDDHA